MSSRAAGLDPRTWLAWAVAASLPALAGRNPLPLLAVLLAVLGVRAAWSEAAPRDAAWRPVVRLAVLFAFLATLFNALTVRAGTTVLFTLPSWLPIIGGPVTLNAVIYGVISGGALLTLVLVGAHVAAVVDWPAALRLLPDRLLTVAVAGSIAIAFAPQTVVAYREIREAQMARGYRPRGARDVAPLLVPLLHGGLERAITLAEALESRAFGAPVAVAAGWQSGRGVITAVVLAVGLAAGYLLAVGQVAVAAVAMLVVVAAFLWVMRPERTLARRSRYRPPRLRRSDVVALAGAGIAGMATLTALLTDPAALRYEPYPRLTVPAINLWLLLAQAGLLAPAFLVEPAGEREERGRR
ncbi:MAG TPA: energy-coupling factor transporter transmembrane component T [Thermomicrobiales bacterium]